jgi:hypothetical protein
VYLAAALAGNAQVYAEYAYYTSAGPGLGPKNIIDFAYQRDLGAHVQLDVEDGFQPNSVNNQRQHYVGAGFSFVN